MGDRETDFTALVHAQGNQLLRMATLLCGDRHQAEDLVQTTLAKAYSKWRLVEKADNPVAYLRTMLTRTFLSDRRRRSSHEVPVDTVGDRPSSAADPTDRMALLDALRQLSPADRAILVLRHWEDRSVAETAHQLGISESACRTRSFRALDRLRALYPALEE